MLLATINWAVADTAQQSAAAIPKAGPKATDVKMHVRHSTPSHFVGQEFTYEILISGTTEVKFDEPDESDDLSVKFLEKVTMDKVTPPSVALRFRMIPMKPGMIQLPMITLEAGGLSLMTDEEAFIDVARPEVYPGLTIERDLVQNDVYLGQSFLAEYTWTSPLPLSGFRAVQLYLPIFYDSAFQVRSLHQWIDPNDKAAIGFPVSNTRLIARYQPLEKEGQFYNTVSFAKIITPVKAGEFTLRPATFLGSYIEPPENQKQTRGWKTNYPSYFNNNFFEVTEDQSFKKYYMASKSQTIRVLPLPDAGKPHDYDGQVGHRSLTVTASPKVVHAGDPITLTIVVNDCDFPETVNLPAIEQQTAFIRQFAMPAKQSAGRIDGKTKTFIRTLRPRAQDVTAIPSLRLPYFDPESKTYKVAESTPIPITVKASETATAFDAQLSGAGPLRNMIEGNDNGIRSNFSRMEHSQLAGLNQWQWFLCFVIIPPVAFAAFYLLSAKNRLKLTDPVAARAQGAMKRFRQSVVKMEKANTQPNSAQQLNAQLQSLDDAIRSYFSDKLNLVRHAHTYEELKQRVGEKMTTDQLLQLREIYDQCEQGQYRGATTPTDFSQLLKSANTLITTIHPQL